MPQGWFIFDPTERRSSLPSLQPMPVNLHQVDPHAKYFVMVPKIAPQQGKVPRNLLEEYRFKNLVKPLFFGVYLLYRSELRSASNCVYKDQLQYSTAVSWPTSISPHSA